MAKKTDTNPFLALEEEAYHAFREWPLWLVLRERELSAHLQNRQTASSPPTAVPVGQAAGQHQRHSTLVEGGST